MYIAVLNQDVIYAEKRLDVCILISILNFYHLYFQLLLTLSAHQVDAGRSFYYPIYPIANGAIRKCLKILKVGVPPTGKLVLDNWI